MRVFFKYIQSIMRKRKIFEKIIDGKAWHVKHHTLKLRFLKYVNNWNYSKHNSEMNKKLEEFRVYSLGQSKMKKRKKI